MLDACPRCFWLKMHMAFKLPWQIFPGIFSSIDAYTKKVTNLHYDRHTRIPSWLEDVTGPGVPMDVPGYSKFCVCHRETGVRLTGVPDEMVNVGNGTWILDYKTAKFTGNQDKLLPMYRCQLNGYSLIADTLGMGPVVGLALVYYEPVTDIGVNDLPGLLLDAGFRMGFTAKVLPIELDAELVPGLLARAKDIFEMAKPPGKRKGCRNCGMLESINQLLAPGR